MSRRESAEEREANAFARAHGVKKYKLNGQGDRGKPDAMYLYGGKAIFIEFKQRGKKPTALQLRELAALSDLGFFVGWTDDAEVAKKWITEQLLRP